MITVEQAISTVERLLADPEYGPRHTANCVYASLRTGKPVCLVGHIIAEHDPETFQKISQGGGFIDTLIEEGDVQVESDALAEALRVAQSQQDRGRSWGMAAEPILALRKRGNNA